MIGVIDIGLGNVGSVVNMLKKLGADSIVCDVPEKVERASKIILPGVGAFDAGITRLKESKLDKIIGHKVLNEKLPLLAICLGMQLITKSSEEGALPGLGWIDAKTTKFKFESQELKIPHMGWNIANVRKNSKLLKNFDEEMRFYFVHSYFVECANDEDVLLTASYGHEFTAAIEHENILAAQFHPEKSHKFGKQLFRNFLENY